MSSTSTIEWTDASWNPVRGCDKISPGCKHCYAETFAERFRGVPGHPYEQGFDLRLVTEALPLPLTWARPRMIFVNSMSDLFHDEVPGDHQARVWQVMRLADWHTFQVLTKRAEGMRQSMPWILRKSGAGEDAEPLLEDLGEIDLRGIDWVIVGGESGPGARPMAPEWVRSIRDQCQAAGVAFFFKQWGGVRKKLAGRELDGRTWDEMPELVRAPYPGRAEAARRREGLAV